MWQELAIPRLSPLVRVVRSARFPKPCNDWDNPWLHMEKYFPIISMRKPLLNGWIFPQDLTLVMFTIHCISLKPGWPLVWMSSPSFQGSNAERSAAKTWEFSHSAGSTVDPSQTPGVGSGQQGRISTSDQGCLWMEVDNVILPRSWYLLRTQRNRTPLKTPTRITSWDVDILVSLLDGFCFDFLPGKSDQGALCHVSLPWLPGQLESF